MMTYILLPCLLVTVSYSLIPAPILPPIPTDCAKVLCFKPECAKDEELYTPSGQCCPKCYKEGDNCGTPGKDCSAIRAPSFLCPDGKTCWGNCGECTFEQRIVTGELECSPWKPKKRVCNAIDCSMIQCAIPLCGPNEKLFYPEGQCCPICGPKLDCTVVLCLEPNCGSNEESYVPDGECCPRCRPKPGVDCTAVLCLAPNCEVENQYTPIGKCCPTCKAPVFCTQEAKLCPDGTYVGRDSNNNCEFFPCPDENGKCKYGQCIDGTGQCVDGSIYNCKAAPCSIDNGGCKDGQLCTDNYCNGCNAVCDKCPDDKYCIDGFGNCVPGRIFYCLIDPCQLNNGGCTDEQNCVSNYCNGCNAICIPKKKQCGDLQCINSIGECQTKICMLDPCNNIKDPCPGQLCSSDTCSYPVCKAQCSPCPKETHYLDGNNRCVFIGKV